MPTPADRRHTTPRHAGRGPQLVIGDGGQNLHSSGSNCVPDPLAISALRWMWQGRRLWLMGWVSSLESGIISNVTFDGKLRNQLLFLGFANDMN